MSTLTRGWNSNNKSTQIKDMAAEPSIRYGLTRERISTTFFGMLRQLPSTSRSPASFLKENQPLFRSWRLDLLFSIPGGQHSVKALQDHSFMCQVQHKTSSSHALHCVHDAPRALWGRRQCHKTRWSRKTLTRSPYSQWRLCVLQGVLYETLHSQSSAFETGHRSMANFHGVQIENSYGEE